MTTENPYAGSAVPTRGTNVLAIISLVAGVIGFNVIAIILGIVALNMIKKSGESGRGLAIAGIILGAIWIVIIIIFVIVAVIAAAAASSYYYSY